MESKIKNKYGKTIGSVEERRGKYTIRDKLGRRIGIIEVYPGQGMGIGAVIAILVIGLLVVLSYKKIPEHLGAAFTEIGYEFLVIVVPILILLVMNIVNIVRNKGIYIDCKDSYFVTLFAELLSGCCLYLAVLAFYFLVEMISGEFRFYEGIFFYAVFALYCSTSFLVLLLPVSLVCAGLISADVAGKIAEKRHQPRKKPPEPSSDPEPFNPEKTEARVSPCCKSEIPEDGVYCPICGSYCGSYTNVWGYSEESEPTPDIYNKWFKTPGNLD